MKHLSTLLALMLAGSAGMASAQTVLFSDTFDTDVSAAYTVTSNTPDFTVQWAYDYAANGGFPAAPSGTGTVGVRIDINKVNGAINGMNLIPTAFTLSPGTAVRLEVDALMKTAGPGTTTEGIAFGVFHNLTAVNRNTTLSSVTAGYYFTMINEGGSARDMRFYTGSTSAAPIEDQTAARYIGGSQETNATDFTNAATLALFPPAVFDGNTNGAAPSTRTNGNNAWVTWRFEYLPGAQNEVIVSARPAGATDFTLIYSNPSVGADFTSGHIFIGYADPFASLSPPDNYVVFDNLTVTELEFTSVDAWQLWN